MGDEPEEEEKDGGGWVVVEAQRKSWEKHPVEIESQTGRLQKLYPTIFSTTGERSIALQQEKYGEDWVRRLEEAEAKFKRQVPRFAKR